MALEARTNNAQNDLNTSVLDRAFTKRQSVPQDLATAANDLQDLLQMAIAGQATNICTQACSPWVSAVKQCVYTNTDVEAVEACACASNVVQNMQTCGSCFGPMNLQSAITVSEYCMNNIVPAIASSSVRSVGEHDFLTNAWAYAEQGGAAAASSAAISSLVQPSSSPILSRSSMTYVPIASRPVSSFVSSPSSTVISQSVAASPSSETSSPLVSATNNVAVAAVPSASSTSTADTGMPAAGGIIAGAVIGGIVLLALVLAAFLFIRRRRARRDQSPILGGNSPRSSTQNDTTERRPSLWSHVSQTSRDPPALPAIPRENLWNESVDPTSEILSPFNDSARASSHASADTSRRSSLLSQTRSVRSVRP
ncbi:hypothetical protein ACM66B_003476 [Microbotryomycetes sp. NB124-2]